MDFKSVLSHVSGKTTKSSGKEEPYLAVKISTSEVLATVWSISDGNVTVGSIGEEKRKSADFEGLLTASDKAISIALADKEMPQAKTIFGVNPDWITDGKIVEEKLLILRRLCKELDLRPLGYVLLGEAIESYLKEIEGAPLTAILIGLDNDFGWVTLFRAGKNLGTLPLPAGESLTTRIEHSLREFTQVDVLPARMILYDGSKDLKTLEEKIMAHPWAKQLPFLHFPKVEVLNSEAVTKAVAIAGGTQMGGRIDIEELGEKVQLEKEEAGNEEFFASKPVDMNEVVEKAELEEISAEEAGFIQEGNLGQLKEMNAGPKMEDLASIIPDTEQKVEFVTSPKVNLPKISFDFKKILSKVKLPAFSFSAAQFPKTPLLIVPIILILLLGLGALIYFIPKAHVFVHVAPKAFNKEMVATISGQTVDVSEIGTKKGVTTGKKLVGVKAHGAVTIYSTSTGKTFPSGTIFTSPNGLKFTLNSDVTIASGSGAASQVTASGNLTAADIGDTYNLPAGTLFTIGSYPSSSYQAKNDSSFTEGSSHQATVVTKLDQDRLLATLSAELTGKAQNDLNSKLSSGQTLLPNAITSVISKKRFSADIDSEADTLSVDLTMDFKGVIISQDDLISRFLDKFSTEIPNGYKLDNTSAKPTITSVKLDKSGNPVLSVTLSAKLLPQINIEELTKNISGKSLSAATSIISQQTGVSSVEIDAEPKLFQSIIDKFLPWKTQNIKMEIVSD